MGHTDSTIRLYASQQNVVLEAIRREGRAVSREEYVRTKYQESAPIFLTAYRWFVEEAQRLVPRPEGAEFPYWAFQDLYSLDQSSEHTLALDVPRDQVVLFDLYDWNKIVSLRYLGESEAEEKAFHRELVQRGLSENQVMLTGFYPELREEILRSWSRLFRHHQPLLAGKSTGVGGVQAGLWQIRAEWIANQ